MSIIFKLHKYWNYGYINKECIKISGDPCFSETEQKYDVNR